MRFLPRSLPFATTLRLLISCATLSGTLPVTLGVVSIFVVSSVSSGSTNAGGILVLDLVPNLTLEDGDEVCTLATLADPALARVTAPADGVPRIAVLYAAFPSDSLAAVAAVSFGLRYPDSVHVLASGPCTGNGLNLPYGQWPRSGAGVGLSLDPISRRAMTPIYWFALSARTSGVFEIVPHPIHSLGGHFANVEMPPRVEAAVAYGKIGFGVAGVVAEFGPPQGLGACCLGSETCRRVSTLECEFYGGLFLGDHVDCDQALPCSPEGTLGACCLPDGCEPMPRRGCVEAGGTYMGPVPCASVDCAGVDAGAEENDGSR